VGVTEQVEQVFREEHGRVLAALISHFRDFELAEDALQDALVVALEHWPVEGVPRNPAAWITTAARRKAVDRVRRARAIAGGTDELERLPSAGAHPDEDAMNTQVFPDERLKLIFTCCHPALAEEAQVALTLRTLGGLTTEEIAKAFLVPAPTMAQRLVRAQRKIRDAGIPYEVPDANRLAERVQSVLAVIYLIFNEGYDATAGDALVRSDVCEEAIRLCGVMIELIGNEKTNHALQSHLPEAMGLLALMTLHHARRDARTDETGQLMLLEAQDRSLWRRDEIEAGARLLQSALRLGRPGPYQIQAAIAALHTEASRAEDTDWQQIAALYDELVKHTPTPVVELNRAAAVAMADGPLRGLMLLDRLRLQDALDSYYLFHATRADLLRRLDLREQAVHEYRRALELCLNETERAFLKARLEEARTSA
jgi:RNA polymerase sigma-70 factor (ECF subfamily)